MVSGPLEAFRDQVPLLEYQKQWVRDGSKHKIVRKGRQTGFSFAASLRAVLQSIERRTTWVFLSKGERQSRLLMDKVGQHVQALNVVAQFSESNFMEGTSIKQLEVRFPNGSVIYGLPANPDTARGYTGYITLDEFARHLDADKIYEALYPTITRGYSVEIISTPNGKQGKYYQIAKAAGLVEGEDGDPASNWSTHQVDIYDATIQGLADMVPVSDDRLDAKWIEMVRPAFLARGINPTLAMLRFVAELRSGVDEEVWLQEFCGQFISTAENFFPPELVQACLKAEASIDAPLELLASEPGEFFLGIDIGRHQDRTVLWLDRVTTATVHDLAGREAPKRISTTRRITTLHRTPFQEQLSVIHETMNSRKSGGQMLVRRACIDATGMGGPLAEALATEFGGRVEPVVFTAPVKEDLAFRTLRKGQGGEIELPDNDAIRRAFGAVKKVVTVAGAIRFDSERTEAGHADEFWAKSLADLAADPIAPPAACAGRDEVEEEPRRPSVFDDHSRDRDEEVGAVREPPLDGEPPVHAGLLENARPGFFGMRRFWR